MSKLPQHYQAAHDALTLLGEAEEANDADLYKLAYDSYMRAIRAADSEEFDKEIYDSYGNVMKPSGKFGKGGSSKRAWEHQLPEDGHH